MNTPTIIATHSDEYYIARVINVQNSNVWSDQVSWLYINEPSDFPWLTSKVPQNLKLIFQNCYVLLLDLRRNVLITSYIMQCTAYNITVNVMSLNIFTDPRMLTCQWFVMNMKSWMRYYVQMCILSRRIQDLIIIHNNFGNLPSVMNLRAFLIIES
jgi:hypothetical protein